jgi:hypothetical protein
MIIDKRILSAVSALLCVFLSSCSRGGGGGNSSNTQVANNDQRALSGTSDPVALAPQAPNLDSAQLEFLAKINPAGVTQNVADNAISSIQSIMNSATQVKQLSTTLNPEVIAAALKVGGWAMAAKTGIANAGSAAYALSPLGVTTVAVLGTAGIVYGGYKYRGAIKSGISKVWSSLTLKNISTVTGGLLATNALLNKFFPISLSSSLSLGNSSTEEAYVFGSVEVPDEESYEISNEITEKTDKYTSFVKAYLSHRFPTMEAGSQEANIKAIQIGQVVGLVEAGQLGQPVAEAVSGQFNNNVILVPPTFPKQSAEEFEQESWMKSLTNWGASLKNRVTGTSDPHFILDKEASIETLNTYLQTEMQKSDSVFVEGDKAKVAQSLLAVLSSNITDSASGKTLSKLLEEINASIAAANSIVRDGTIQKRPEKGMLGGAVFNPTFNSNSYILTQLGIPQVFVKEYSEQLNDINVKLTEAFTGSLEKLLTSDAIIEVSSPTDEDPNATTKMAISDIFNVLLASKKPEADVFIPPELALGSDISTRDMRVNNGVINYQNLALNQRSGAKVFTRLPLSLALKGNVNNLKTESFQGAISSQIGKTTIGVTYAYVNQGEGFNLDDSFASESSLLVSRSFGDVFVEAKIGLINSQNIFDIDTSGSRTHFKLGIDTCYVSPFIQWTETNLNTGKKSLKSRKTFVGLDFGAADLQCGSAWISNSLLIKGGLNQNKKLECLASWISGVSFADGVVASSQLEWNPSYIATEFSVGVER